MRRSFVISLPIAITALLSPSIFAGSGIITTVLVTGAGIQTPPVLQSTPSGLWVDSAGNVLVADNCNQRIIRVNPANGTYTVVAGSGSIGFSGDGGPGPQAQLNYPYGVTVDAAGNVFISDSSNNRVRRVDAQTGVITTFAGTGSSTSSGDGGPAANAGINGPLGLAFDGAGNLFIAEERGGRIRRVDAQSGLISTVAGNGSMSSTPDGVSAAGASLAGPAFLAFDPLGNLLFGEFGSAKIRRIDANGILGTVAGNGQTTYGGDGVPATSAAIGAPGQPFVDGAGNLYFPNVIGGRIFRVDAGTGLISTIGGNGNNSTSNGDGGPATSAAIGEPTAVVLIPGGDLLVTDGMGNSVRRIALGPPPIATTTTVSGPASATSGQNVTFTATVAPMSGSGTPTGSVQFLDAATALGTATLSGGSASIALNTLSQGTHAISASYAGDNTFAGSVAPAISVSITAAKVGTAVTLTSGINPQIQGAQVPYQVTVTPAGSSNFQPTGTVQLMDGASLLASGTLSGGSVTIMAALSTLGDHSLTAVYSGDNNFLGATSPAIAETIRKNTPIVISSDTNPSTVGQTINLTGTVNAAATGTIQFIEYPTPASSPFPIGSANVVNGTAVLPIASLSAGTHLLAVSYSGDSTYIGGTSSYINQVVRPATTTALTANPASVTYGQAVQLTASVSPASATGSVTFQDGGTTLGTASLSAGTASLTASSLAAGSHAITAAYAGDANNGVSTSTTVTVTVAKATPTVSLTSSQNPAASGQAVTFTIAVAPNTAGGPVQLMDGAAVAATVTLSGGTATASLTPSIGNHTMTAVYAGDSNFAGATSPAVAQLITTTTTTALTANPASATYGQAVQFTATVSPTPTGGTVQFFDGSTALGTATLSGAPAQLTVSTLAAGSHAITATYGGDGAGYLASTSAAVSETIGKAASTAALATSANPVNAGQAVTFTATVSPATATGTVQFQDGGTAIGTTTVNNGSAALTISSLTAGAHTIAAAYSGDGNYNSSSASLSQTVQAVSSVALQSSAATAAYGQNVQFTATVTPAAATGSVQFLDGSTVLGTAVLSGGSGALWTASLAVGTHAITAVYSGDTNDTTGASAALTETITKAAAAGTVASSLNPSVAGQAVTFTATVSPATATGTVQFLDGATSLGTVTLSGGAATLATAGLAAGSHTITASYSGDGNFNGASQSLAQTVKAAPAVSLSSNNPSATFGQTVQFTATVSPASATGTIQFLDGSTAIGTAPLSGGVAVFATAALAVGAHSITAAYGGDANDAGATSAAVPETIAKAPASAAVSSSLNPSVAGQSVTFTATVSPASATGTVQFLDGATSLGTVALSGGAAAFATASLAAGSHTITATYSGDGNYNGASQSLAQTVKATTATSLTANPAQAVAGQNVQFTATVTSGATGTVQFLDGAASLGTVTLSGGTAALSTSSLAVGTHTITAAYSGDGTHAPSTSAAWTETIVPAAPANLAATAASSSQINLSWTASTTAGVTYNVYSSTASGFTPSPSNRIATGLTGTTYAHTGLSPSTTHYYLVTAQGALESAASNQAGATTQGGLSCHVGYSVTTQWNVGFGTAITIQNTGSTAINGWQLTWTWAGNQQITQSWNSNYSQSGANAKLTNATWNATIGAGQTLSGMGFNASYSGSNPAPAAFYVNGTLCH